MLSESHNETLATVKLFTLAAAYTHRRLIKNTEKSDLDLAMRE